MVQSHGSAMSGAAMPMGGACLGASDTHVLMQLAVVLFFVLVGAYFAARLMAFAGQSSARRICDATHVVLALGMVEMFAPTRFAIVPFGLAAVICGVISVSDGVVALQIRRGAMRGTAGCVRRCGADCLMALGMGYMFWSPAGAPGLARFAWIGYFAYLGVRHLGLAARLVPTVWAYERSAQSRLAESSQDHPTPRFLQSVCQLGMGAAMAYMFAGA